MSDSREHRVELRFVRGYEFVATFKDDPALEPIVFDEPPPLGEGSGPNAAAVLAAAVGDCLAASFAFCLRKVRLEPVDLSANVIAHVARNEQGRFRISGIDVELVPEVQDDDPARIGSLRASVRRLLRRDRECPSRHSGQCQSPDSRPTGAREGVSMATMKAVVFRGEGRVAVEEVPKPVPRPGEAVIRITTTTICGTDVHIVRGEYPVKPGLILGHEPVGVIEELGADSTQLYRSAQRVIVGAITPCGQCFYCLNGAHSQCGGRARRLALRQHHQRRVGRVPARAGRARQPRADSGRADRRRGAAVPRHLLDRAVGRRKRRHQGRRLRWRFSRRGRSGLCATLGAQAERRGADHRRSTPSPHGSRWPGASAPT